MNFVIEKLPEEDYSLLFDAITQNRGKYEIVKYLPFSKVQKINTPLDAEDTIFIGTIGMGRYVRKNTNWIGAWCNFEKFKCTNYYSHIGEYLINSDYTLLSLHELVRRQDELFEKYGNEFFVRPDSGMKPFTGNIIRKNFIKSDLISLAPTDVDREQLVIISSKKEILAEWRFFVFDGVPRAASQYHKDGELYVDPYVPSNINIFAYEVASKYQPESAFVLDIGVTDDKIGVVELNSFSCSGMYACNKEDIIRHAIKTLNNELEELNEPSDS